MQGRGRSLRHWCAVTTPNIEHLTYRIHSWCFSNALLGSDPGIRCSPVGLDELDSPVVKSDINLRAARAAIGGETNTCARTYMCGWNLPLVSPRHHYAAP